MKKPVALMLAVAMSVFSFTAFAAETVLVFGGNRATGLETVKALVAKKDKVTVVIRPSAEVTDLKALGVTMITGDVLQPVMIEKCKGEDYLVNSGLDYTIIRPGGLKNGPATGKTSLTADHTAHSDINREELGKLVASSVTDKAMFRKIMHAVDPTLPSAEMK